MNLRTAVLVCAAATLVAGTTSASALRAGPAHRAPESDDGLVQAFDNVSRSTAWTRTATLDLDFETHHPQAMEVVGDRIYLSSVEIIEPTVRYPEPVDGYDRTPGKGIGHLFILDRDGQLLKDIVISDGHRYHPGGLDYDGEFLWLPVAEYRPNSSADIYRIDPTTYDVTKLFTVSDHIGGVVRDQETGHLVGQSWGSRRFYDWTVGGRQKGFWLNENHLLDYQDCEYVDSRKALCSGVTGLPAQPGAATGYELGGLVMIDLRDRHRILHEVPLQLWSTAGHVITRNPTDLDADGSHLTLYAAPDDSGEAAGTQLLVYEADVTPLS
jgi:hypothetical protein